MRKNVPLQLQSLKAQEGAGPATGGLMPKSAVVIKYPRIVHNNLGH